MNPATDPVFPDPFQPMGTWMIFNKIDPVLTTKWNNGSDLSKYCPNHTVGFGPIAVAQTVASHTYPQTYQGHCYQWNKMLSGYFPDSSDGINSTARLIADIDPFINDEHDKFAIKNNLPCSVQLAFDALGYTYEYDNYDFDACLNSLLEGNPVTVIGYSEYGNRVHYWVIDGGYKRVLCEDIGFGGTPHYVVYATKKYVHCNWGFGGNGNGYFLSGAFNPSARCYLSSQDTESGIVTDYAFNKYVKAYYNSHPSNN